VVETVDTSNVREAGMAARETVDSRLRAIAMSVITTIFNLAPLVFIPGRGTELYRGLGAIVLSGLAGAAIVTHTFLPALTVGVLAWSRRRRGAGDTAAVALAEAGAGGPAGGARRR
jgi:Cu/Ag efflux pump CusA